ncbi:hypothetical protein EDB80DRAFT_871791 [Ilyonectria destructans]|nr:hypothetical protein EDB80DRAFT_871791 [Ilyonectria destructans]
MTSRLRANRDSRKSICAHVCVLEIEQKYRLLHIDDMIDALADKRLESHRQAPKKQDKVSQDEDEDEDDSDALDYLHAGVTKLKTQLIIWKTQLNKLIHAVKETFDEGLIRGDYMQQAASLAIQKELADLARKDSKVAIGDAKQMKAIALLTMIFFPSTAVAGFMDAQVYNWERKGHMFWAISGCLTATIVLAYLVWTMFSGRKLINSVEEA